MDTKDIQRYLMKKGKLPVIIAAFAVYLVFAIGSYFLFSYLNSGGNDPALTAEYQNATKSNASGRFAALEKKYASLPKTEECPLNGRMQSKPERANWEKRRPLGVMVENSTSARPQSGLSLADVVYEAVAEGGITRFLAVFYCKDAEAIGPVRSARTYYLDWISEYGENPLYAHVGGANTDGPADALQQIINYGWAGYNDLNHVNFPTFWRDYERLGNVATEHTVYTATDKAWAFAAKDRGLTNVATDDSTGAKSSWTEGFIPWKFKNDAPLKDRPAKQSAQFNFSNTQAGYLDDYAVSWKYDKDSNSYLRSNGGKPFKDLNTNQQVSAKNVVILYMPMSVVDDGYNEDGHGSHLIYGNKGTGKAIFLLDGKEQEGTWQKAARTDRTIFYDEDGNELKLNRGLTWIEILPTGQSVKVE